MPSLATVQPYATRPLDLIDATDRSYRQIESAWASALQIQKAVRDLMNIDPVTGLATPGAYFMPSSIVDRTMYETYINFLNNVNPGAIAGALDVDTVTFTPTASLTWPVNGLRDLYWIRSYVALSYDPQDSTTYLLTPISSNTADTVVSDGAMFANADTVELVSKNMSTLEVLWRIIGLSYTT